MLKTRHLKSVLLHIFPLRCDTATLLCSDGNHTSGKSTKTESSSRNAKYIKQYTRSAGHECKFFVYSLQSFSQPALNNVQQLHAHVILFNSFVTFSETI